MEAGVLHCAAGYLTSVASEFFRFFWKHTSKADARQPKISLETIALVKEMVKNNRLWGAERIRGELLKLDIRVCKRTIQKYMHQARLPRPGGQKWVTFLHNHAADIWACNFLQVTDLFFHPLFAFFLIELNARKVIHVGVTRSPPDAWTAQQLREATPFGQTPKYLIRDNDSKFGSCFARVAATSGIKILKTPYHAPRANAVCERFLGSVRRECLDHLLILGEKQLHRVLHAYVEYFNRVRPHQGIQQQVPVQGLNLADSELQAHEALRDATIIKEKIRVDIIGNQQLFKGEILKSLISLAENREKTRRRSPAICPAKIGEGYRTAVNGAIANKRDRAGS